MFEFVLSIENNSRAAKPWNIPSIVLSYPPPAREVFTYRWNSWTARLRNRVFKRAIRVICIRKRGFEGSEFATRAAHPGVNVYTGEIDYQFRLWSGRDSTGTRLIPPFYRSFSPRFTSRDYVFSYDSVFA